MKQVDIIIYEALTADAELMDDIGHRIKSTCFEVAPTEQDNVDLPYIIVTDDGFQNQVGTKDDLWESEEDRMQASIEISAKSPAQVKELVKRVRRTVNEYIIEMAEEGESIPELEALTSDGISWDWTKPCYFQTLTYQCIIQNEEYED